MPVSAQMTTVDQKVPVIATSACCAGLRVEAADATMSAEPRPDSLENRPRAVELQRHRVPAHGATRTRPSSERAFQDKAQRVADQRPIEREDDPGQPPA